MRGQPDEFEEAEDPVSALTPGEIAARTVVQVVDAGSDRMYGTGDDVIVDQETSTLTFAQDAEVKAVSGAEQGRSLED